MLLDVTLYVVKIGIDSRNDRFAEQHFRKLQAQNMGTEGLQ